ncbi:E3 ubiquitin-protein ligase ZFP91-like [Engraulis encrasicolus]|uniref:E3 ubiquitin-protein ligase ZFP91-like n=1 Tax=Engraulis encrasicolus TaxID=184585 RepID=UPI002FD4ACEA
MDTLRDWSESQPGLARVLWVEALVAATLLVWLLFFCCYRRHGNAGTGSTPSLESYLAALVPDAKVKPHKQKKKKRMKRKSGEVKEEEVMEVEEEEEEGEILATPPPAPEEKRKPPSALRKRRRRHLRVVIAPEAVEAHDRKQAMMEVTPQVTPTQGGRRLARLERSASEESHTHTHTDLL